MEENLALYTNGHYIKKWRNQHAHIRWVSESKIGQYIRSDEVSYLEYLEIVKSKEYSILMKEGGIIQLSLKYRGRSLIGYRYAYMSCPIYLDEAQLRVSDEDVITFTELIERFSEDGIVGRFRIGPILRFEYDPESTGADHPVSHVHLGKSSSRIPVSRPIMLKQFLRFVFKNFYPTEFADHSEINQLGSQVLPETITNEQRSELHVHVS